MDLKSKLDAVTAEARAILAKAETEGRAMSAEEVSAFDAKMAEVNGLKATIERQALVAEAQPEPRKMAMPETQEVRKQETAPEFKRAEVVERKREPGEVLGVIVRALHTHKGDKLNALHVAERNYGGSSPEYRALGASDFTAGGALVPDEFSSEIIPLMAATAVFRQAGARVLPLRGTLEIPKMTGGVTGYWVGENAAITPSEGTFGSVKLVEKKLAAVTPISNDLLRLGGSAVDLLIRDNIVRALSNAEDLAFFKGAGTAYTPKGIYYQAPTAHVAATAGTSLANFRTDILNCANLLEADNIPIVRRAWFHNPRTTNYMKWSLVDSNSNFSFPDLRANNTLNDWTVYNTNNITTATNVEKYLVEMSAVYIGDGPGLEIQIRDGAAWDNSGTTVAGYSYDQSVIRAIKVTDMVLANENAVAVRHTVTV